MRKPLWPGRLRTDLHHTFHESGTGGRRRGRRRSLATQTQRFKRLVATERRRLTLLILAWGVAISSVFAQALYQRSYLTIPDFAVVFIICIIAGAIALDIGIALLGYIGSMIIGTGILFVMAILPVIMGNFPPQVGLIMFQLWVSIIFKSIFPFPFLIFLIGSIIGSALGEKYL